MKSEIVLAPRAGIPNRKVNTSPLREKEERERGRREEKGERGREGGDELGEE